MFNKFGGGNMKKALLMLIIFGFTLMNQLDLNSRSEFKAPPGHIWSTPNGKDREDGTPRSKATLRENGSVSIGGGCNPTPGTCWELAEDKTLLIVYDLVIHPGPGEDLIFVPVPDTISSPPQQ